MSSVQARRQHKVLVAVHQAAIIDFIASFADQALRVELMLTPKQGLVDQRNSGAGIMDTSTAKPTAKSVFLMVPPYLLCLRAASAAANRVFMGAGGLSYTIRPARYK